ncbi:hypothetical protein ACLF3G_21950 [Falsiroseomonas sp. HC035]
MTTDQQPIADVEHAAGAAASGGPCKDSTAVASTVERIGLDPDPGN